MRHGRLIRVLTVLGFVGAGIVWGGSAGAVGASATLSFSATRELVEMSIPSAGCPSGGWSCTWMLYVNEPGVSGQPTVAEVTGTSGTLVIPYPPDFCGVIQADALVGPGHWVYQTGTRESIHTCPGPIVPPPGGGVPPGGVTSTVTPPPGGSTGTFTSTSTSSVTLEPASSTTAATGATGTGSTASGAPSTKAVAATTLPFTGLDPAPLLWAGLSAVTAGAVLLADTRSVRRLRWITDTGPVRALGSFLDWIVGH